jgi:hypothetical protein
VKQPRKMGGKGTFLSGAQRRCLSLEGTLGTAIMEVDVETIEVRGRRSCLGQT